MKTISAKTFQINIPAPFEHLQTMWECIRAEHKYEYGNDDHAMMTIALYENSYYNKFKGRDFKACFYNCCKERRGEVEIIEDKSFNLAGGISYVCMAKSSYGYFYYFAVLQINETYSYDFVGDCPADKYEFYIPFFEKAWKSLQFFDGQVEAMEEQNKGIDALYKIQANSELPAEGSSEIPQISSFQVPVDGTESFMINGVSFEYHEDSNCSINTSGDTGDSLSIYLKASISNYQHYDDILNDYDEGEVYFRFDVKEIYQNGIPTGKFSFEKDRNVQNQVSIWKGGFHYSLSLFGELSLKDGWMGFDGYFRDIMETKVYTVNLAKKIQTENLQWEYYRFSSLAEASTAPPLLVRHLQLNNLMAVKLPDEIFNYTKLESLNVFYDKGFRAERLDEIPKAIDQFSQLKNLSFYWIDLVKEIPAEIGMLKKLRSLSIVGTQAKSIPAEVLQLPDLEFCTLSDNQLVEIPAELPAGLKSLYLQKNQLKTLPPSILNLNQLKWVNITDNPFESLPADLNKITHLDLELEKKQSLLDFAYKGADGLGTVAFDNSLFSALSLPELQSLLDKQISGSGLDEYKKGLEMLALWSVGLETVEPDKYSRRGNTRFGGLPDLPKGMEYPTFNTYHNEVMGYQFIAQLNCEELSPYQSYLPANGVLYFFITDQEDFGAKVLYSGSDLSALQSAADLEIDEDFIYDEQGIFEPFIVKAAKYVSLPSFYNDGHLYQGEAAHLHALEEGDVDLIDKFRQSLEPHNVKPMHSINSYVFKQHGSPQIEAANKFKGKPEDYMVLLRVGSDNHTGFSFWDAGEIYFVIHKSDLAKADFSNVFCGLESS